MTLYHILYLYMQEKKFYKKMSKPLTVTMVRLRGRGLILCFMPRRKTGTLICHKTGTLIIHYLVLSVLANGMQRYEGVICLQMPIRPRLRNPGMWKIQLEELS